jgi:hypothetical protein
MSGMSDKLQNSFNIFNQKMPRAQPTVTLMTMMMSDNYENNKGTGGVGGGEGLRLVCETSICVSG